MQKGELWFSMFQDNLQSPWSFWEFISIFNSDQVRVSLPPPTSPKEPWHSSFAKGEYLLPSPVFRHFFSLASGERNLTLSF